MTKETLECYLIDDMKLFKKLHIPIFVAVLTVSALIITIPSFADDYFIYDEFGGTWHDANKDWDGDTDMCWAGAASNILTWGGWGTPDYSTADVIFDKFETHWTDDGGMMEYGWDWWLNGTEGPGLPGWSEVDVSGGGNYWPGHDFDSYYHENWDTSQAMSAIDNYFDSGYGVGLAIYAALGGHALTVWGYGYDDNNKNYYDKIWVTDSDDALTNNLVSYPVSLKGKRWRLGGGYEGWYIGGVESLALVPEPVSSILFLVGGVSLAAAAYRRRKIAV